MKDKDYDSIKSILAVGFINFLDEHRAPYKMCLSNSECGDIHDAFAEQDWAKLARYVKKKLTNE